MMEEGTVTDTKVKEISTPRARGYLICECGVCSKKTTNVKAIDDWEFWCWKEGICLGNMNIFLKTCSNASERVNDRKIIVDGEDYWIVEL
jgi:hypothetical protein